MGHRLLSTGRLSLGPRAGDTGRDTGSCYETGQAPPLVKETRRVAAGDGPGAALASRRRADSPTRPTRAGHIVTRLITDLSH